MEPIEIENLQAENNPNFLLENVLRAFNLSTFVGYFIGNLIFSGIAS